MILNEGTILANYLLEDFHETVRKHYVRLLKLVDSSYDPGAKTDDQIVDDMIDLAGNFPNKKDTDSKQVTAAKAAAYINSQIAQGGFKKGNKTPATSATTSAATSASEKIDSPEPLSWPKYIEWRKKWYKQTCDLGWPKNIKAPGEAVKNPDNEDGILYPWTKVGNIAYPFGEKGWGVVQFKNYSNDIKAYLLDHFKNDVKALEDLSNKIQKILDAEKSYFKTKSITNFMGQLALNLFRGIGGTQSDENFFKWIVGKTKGMTIFEYQDAIVSEVLTKMKVSDNTAEVLKNLLFPIKKIVETSDELHGYTFTNPKISYRYQEGYVAAFNVTTPTGRIENVASPYYHLLKGVVLPLADGKNIKSKSGNLKLDEKPTKEEIESILKHLEPIIKDKKNNPENAVPKDPIRFAMNDYSSTEKEKNGNPRKKGVYVVEFDYISKGAIILVKYETD